MTLQNMFSDRTNWKLTRNRLSEAIDEMRSSGSRFIDLTVSNPTRVGLKFDDARILRSLAPPAAMNYDPQPKGLLGARAAIAEYYQFQHGALVDPERLVLTTSTSEGYSFVFRLLCNPGDELLVPKPSYPLFEFLADLQDVKLVSYPLIYDHGWQIDFHSLRGGITGKTRAVVVVHPNNPTGSFVHPEERESLNAVCREHKLAVIADEVFLDYTLEGAAHRSFVTNHSVLSFTLSGVSKITALPQMKVAWIATTGPIREIEESLARLEIIADTYLSMNAPIQWAAPVLLEQRHGIQSQLIDRVRANLSELDRQLASQSLCERLLVEGGWYAVLRVPAVQSDEEMAVDLLRKESVLVHPGHFYDFSGDGYLVLSLIGPETEFADGVARVLQRIGSRQR
jgi:alanine-synthesizing transaminase